jgi:hypothetical protein
MRRAKIQIYFDQDALSVFNMSLSLIKYLPSGQPNGFVSCLQPFAGGCVTV